MDWKEEAQNPPRCDRCIYGRKLLKDFKVGEGYKDGSNHGGEV